MFVDGSDGRPVDVIEGHDKRAVEARIRKFPKGERLAVEIFTCDMSGAFWRAAKAQLPNATVRPGKFHVVALAESSFEDARRRVNKRPNKPAAGAERIWKPLVADRSRLCRAPRARHWQSQEEPGAKAAERRNRAFAKIAGALAGDDENHRELRRAYLMLQLSCEWAGADFVNDRECREALSNWISQAEGCGVKEIATAARSDYFAAFATPITHRLARNTQRGAHRRPRRARRR